MHKKMVVVFVLVLTFAFSTTAFASLTFTSSAITGTTASTIDVGGGNTLSLQTTNNAPITTGSGLVTLGGNLNIIGTLSCGSGCLSGPWIHSATYTYLANTGDNVGIGNTSPGALLDLGLAGTVKGVLRLAGNTSGNVTIQPAAAAGAWTLTLPTSGGTNGQVLATNGSGTTSWNTITTDTTTLTGGLKITYTGKPQFPLILPLVPGIVVVPTATVSGQTTYSSTVGPTIAAFTYVENALTNAEGLTTLSFDDLVGVSGSFSPTNMLLLTALGSPTLTTVNGNFGPFWGTTFSFSSNCNYL